MKGAMLAWSLLSFMLACTPARRAEEIKQVQVTAESLKTHAADRPFVVELTRGGTLYHVAADVDPSLVEVRDAAGTVPLSALARRFTGSGNSFLIGTLDDLNVREFGFPPDQEGPQPADTGAIPAKCVPPTPQSPGICNCTGTKDCSDMNRAGFCAGGSNKSAVCGKDANDKWGCSCVAKGS